MSDTKFAGDGQYSVDCAGTVVAGDRIAFSRAQFKGEYPHTEFVGYETVRGEVTKESYSKKGQHTFQLALDEGGKLRIMGRNLYKNSVWRQPWADESQRKELAAAAQAHGHTPEEDGRP